MNFIILIVALISVFALAYVLLFTESTLILGIALSDTKVGSGFQDVITPPSRANFHLAAYFGPFAIATFVGWRSGTLSGLGILVAMFLAVTIAKRLLRQAGRHHFTTQIVQSMGRRYAEYVKNGDPVRAQMMGELLQKMGVDLTPQTPVSAVKKASNYQTAAALVRAFGPVIEAHAATQNIVTDSSKLPAPKEAMRAAIISYIWTAPDKRGRDILKASYLMLAEFQPGIGLEPIRIDTQMSSEGVDKDSLTKILAQTTKYTQWGEVVKKEMASLQKDLIDLRVWAGG